jgi:hypothetical protein
MMNGDGDDERRALAELFREQDRTLAEAKAEREHKELTKRVDPETGLAYRDAPEIETADWSGWEQWIGGHQSILKTEILDLILDNVPAFVCTYTREKLEQRDRKIADLEGELADCKGMLSRAVAAVDDARKDAAAEAEKQRAMIDELRLQEAGRVARDRAVIERSGRIAELQRSNAESHAQLSAQQRERELAERDHRIALVEQQLKMLLMHMGLQGLDPPRF